MQEEVLVLVEMEVIALNCRCLPHARENRGFFATSGHFTLPRQASKHVTVSLQTMAGSG